MISRIAQQDDSDKKRSLKKVRRCFLNRQPEHRDLALVDPAARYLNTGGTYVINATTGIAEVNRRIYIGPQYVNIAYKVDNFLIEDCLPTQPLTLSLTAKEECNNCPIEYSLKRLESFGDLELATWVHSLEKHFQKYPKMITEFYKILHSNDIRIQEALQRGRDAVLRKIDEIESRYPYCRAGYGFYMDASKPLSFSFSESFLEEIGHTHESFLSLVESNGIPTLFDAESTDFIKFVKHFYNGKIGSGQNIIEGSEYEIDIYHKSQEKKKVVGQNIVVLLPNMGLPVVYSYFIIKNSLHNQNEVNHLATVLEKVDLKSNFNYRAKKQIKTSTPLDESWDKIDKPEEIFQKGMA